MSIFGLLDILTIILLVLYLWGLRPSLSNSAANNYLAKDKMLALKGIVVIIPIIVHLLNMGVYGGPIINFLSRYGEFLTNLFFMISGYGLTKQHLIKENYAKGFLLHRFSKILIPYIIATFLYVVANFVFNGFLYWPSDIILAILRGDPVAMYSWYVIHTILFYLWFYFMMRICGKKKNLLIVGGLLYYIVTTCAFMALGYGMHWWGSSLGIIAGIIFGSYEEQIFKFFYKNFYLKLLALLAVGAVIFCVENALHRIYWIDEHFPTHTVFDLFISIFLFISLVGFEVGNPVSRFLGKYSYEIYILQGLFILAGRSAKMHLDGNMYIMFALVGSIVSGIALFYVDKFILSKLIRK